MFRRKAFSFTLAVMLSVSLILAGCSSSGADNEANGGGGNAKEQKTIEFLHLWPEGNSKDHYVVVQEIVSAYEDENPNVKIDVKTLSNEQYKKKIKVLASSNKLPDVGMTWSNGYLTPYVEGNKFAPLNDVMEAGLKDTFVNGMVRAYSVDGKNYGIPLELNIAPIWYNKSIFEKYGLEVPKTYDEFKNVITTLRDNGVIPIALGGKGGWTASLWYMNIANKMAGKDVITKAINGEMSFEDPALVNAAKKFKELVDMGAFSKGAAALTDQEAKAQFMNGQAAMYCIGTWDLPNYTTNEDVPQEFRDSVDFFNFPKINGNGDPKAWVGGPGVGLFVAQNSDVKKQAKDFAAFFAKQWGEKSVTEVGAIPATKVDVSSLDDMPELYIKALKALNNASNITVFADTQMNPDAAQTHYAVIKGLLNGSVTPEEFGAKQQAALEKAE